MSTQLAQKENIADLAQIGLDEASMAILLKNDFSKASDEQRSMCIMALCQASGVNPAFTPFGFIETGYGASKQLKLYPKVEYFEIMAKEHNVSVEPPRKDWDAESRLLTLDGSASSRGRTTPACAVLYIPEFYEWTDRDGAKRKKKIEGQELGNLHMKARTKYFRRAVKTHLGMSTVPEFGDELIHEDFVSDTNPRGSFFAMAANAGLPTGSDEESREERRKLYCEVLGREVTGGPELSDADWQKMTEYAERIYTDKRFTMPSNGEEVTEAEFSEPTEDPGIQVHLDRLSRLTRAIESVGLIYAEDHIELNAAFSKILERDVLEIGELVDVEVDKVSDYFEAVKAGKYRLRPALQQAVDSRNPKT